MSAVFAQIVRRNMRREHVTIRALAGAMCVTMKRVREVRNHGTPPSFAHAPSTYSGWMQDWLDGIDRAKTSANIKGTP